MKKIAKYISAFIVCLFSAVLLTACGEAKIVKGQVKNGTLQTVVVLNSEFDTSNTVVTYTYDNKKTKDVSASELTFSTIDTTTVGNKTLEITYQKFTFNITIKVVATINDVNTITNFTSELVTEYNANSGEQVNKQEEFYQTGKTHLTGDDNPLDFRTLAKGINDDGDIVENIKNVSTVITLEKVTEEGNNLVYTPLTQAEYNDVVEAVTNDTIDFKEAAINNTYRITVTLSDLVNFDVDYFENGQTPRFQLTTKVVDGYNVDEAKELSLFDNSNAKKVSCLQVSGESYEVKWNKLKKEWGYMNENGSLKPEYNINALILQKDLEITDDVVPEENFYSVDDVNRLSSEITSKNSNIAGSLIDTAESDQGIYVRNLKDGETFNFYGNYFTVNAKELTRALVEGNGSKVIPAGSEDKNANDKNAEDYITIHTPLFRFNGANNSNQPVSATTGENSNAVANLEDVYFIGNGERTANNSSSSLASGGIILLKARALNFNAKNTIYKDFNIGYFTEYGYDKVFKPNSDISEEEVKNNGYPETNNKYTIIGCKGYNAYNTLLYFWGSPNVYMQDVEMIGAGGPAMIADHAAGDDNVNFTGDQFAKYGYPTYINIVNSNIASYVGGAEPWFVTYGASSQIGQIKAIDQAYLQTPSTILTSDGSVNGLLNIVLLMKWGAKSLPAGAAYTRGTCHIFENIDEYNKYYGLNGQTEDKTGVFGYDRKSTACGVAYSTRGATIFESNKTGGYVTSTGTHDGTFYNGKYVNMYMANGFGAILGLYPRITQA